MKTLVVSCLLAAAGCSDDAPPPANPSKLHCPTPVEAYCAERCHAPCSWAEWDQSPPFPPPDPSIQCVRYFLYESDGPYATARYVGIDTGEALYYDRISGNLVAVAYFGPDAGDGCRAGPADGFSPPTEPLSPSPDRTVCGPGDVPC